MPKVGPRSRFVTPPAADGSIHTETLGWPEVVALTSTTSLVRIEGKTVAAERIVFVYDPGRTTLAAQLPEGSRYLGQVRRRLFAASRSGRPVELCGYLPVYQLPASTGSGPACRVLLPEGFDPQTRLHAGLVAELERDLAHHGVLGCRRRTLAPARAIRAIAARQPERNWEAMARDRFEVLYLAIDAVYLNEEKGAHRPALQVVACHPAEGIRCPVALIEMRDGHRSKVIARLARVLLRLPRPEALLALATDCGLVERAIVAQALAMAQVRCPTLAPRLVPGRFHLQDLFADKMNDFRIATWQGLGRGKDGRKLKYLSKKAQDGVWNIKQAAKALKTRWARLRQNDDALA